MFISGVHLTKAYEIQKLLSRCSIDLASLTYWR